ncbi:hypothetical protein SAMN05421780_102292 [Flexibacter flexilis DSM 6793]|uniref:Uncharacterized protein n=1 Tax=Flexibacter flexilis DSM 6793 TaxID=927664 RepID=A0A1I1FRF6_9BACT|nr:hypothetical protein SAMN05421780_102292 [Flexibacter flexilis DSM 6793]
MFADALRPSKVASGNAGGFFFFQNAENNCYAK